MSNDKNSKNLDKEREESKLETPKENIFQKGWNDFVSGVTEGFKKFQKVFEEQSKQNKEVWDENREKIASFFKETNQIWENKTNDWNTELEKMQIENKEQWDKNKDKIEKFFTDTKQTWDNKFKEWTNEIQQKQIETKEQWEARKQKISEDIKAWQDKTRQDWEKGIKSWRREMIKGSYLFLVFMLPILIVMFVIIWLIDWLLRG